MAPTTRRGPNTPVNDTNPNNITPESIQAMIDQALLRNSTNGDGSHSSHGDNRRNVQTARPCFYADFMKCQPLNFKGAEGVVGLTRWIEKMESVFNISGCAVENQVKFATCTLLGAALTWWNGQIRTLGPEAYAMTWEVLKRKMTDKYCPQGEIKKLEIELWNLKVKGNDVPAYTERFQELTLICTKFVANETEKVDKYLSGLPDNIYGNVKAAKPKTLDETIELANDLMDRKLLTYAERQSDNKRKADDSSRNNHGHQQQPFKRQNVARAYNMGTGERKPYGGSLPKCNKCHLHHNGPCTQRCHKCNKIGHFARDCRSTGNTSVANTQKGNGATPKGNGCFECGAPGHFKRDCPKLKNKNGGNGNAQGWVYAVGNAEKRGDAPGNPDANVVTGTFLLNNHYASILFDTGADRSFISTAFSSLINIAPTSLENCYDVELADGKLVAINTIIRGCTLNFLDHPFNIDLMPVELGSFDVIIGMDWLRRYHAVIVCDEKLVQVPYGNETLTFRGNESSNGRESRLAVISYSKAQEYMAKGCQVFLAQISAKKEEDKSERKQIEDTDRGQGLHVDPGQIEYIKDWGSPKEPKEIAILGLAGYYRGSLKDFLVRIAKSMTKNYSEEFKFDWGEKEERFQLIKRRCASAPSLALLKGAKDFGFTVMRSHKVRVTEDSDVIFVSSGKANVWLDALEPDRQKELRDSEAESDGSSKLDDRVMLRLELPQEFSRVHHTFHVSNLKKCYADEPLVMPLEGIHVDDKLPVCGESPLKSMKGYQTIESRAGYMVRFAGTLGGVLSSPRNVKDFVQTQNTQTLHKNGLFIYYKS
ncbi:putative reverse transcriptase domain-containing protein [Tanacetum coccineum]